MADKETGAELIAAINREGALAPRDPSESERAIMERILKTGTYEELFNMAGTQGADDVLERPFMLRHATFNESTFQEGSGIYAVLEVDFADTGESEVITCGGKNVCTQLIRTVQLGGDVPFPLMFWKPAKPTANGFYPLWLRQAPANAA